MNAHLGPVIAARDGLRVIDCRACGWAHLDPLSGAAELTAYYTDEFWQKDKAGWLARYETQREWDEMRANDWLGIAERMTDGRTLLDIGSGYGQLIETAGRRGWDAIGVEPSKSAAEYAIERGLEIYMTTAADFFRNYAAPEYDCISALWVLEHEPDPLAFLDYAGDFLNGTGLLILAVPNEFNADQYAANECAAVRDWFVHKTHVNYFTPATIANLLGRAGFVIVDALATYPIERHIPQRQDYTGRPEVGDNLHGIIRTRELQLDAGRRVADQRTRARIGIGRDLIIFARPA